ncbi:MAG TPA: hypothetical protein PKK11_01105 [Methanothrix sp.]|nr:hypothetical protein [Methanothrix sp.]HPT18518.1 hypothetical protein [Methanothrix sp.]
MQWASILAYLAASELRLLIYFLLGGAVTAFTVYLAGQGRGMAAAFITTLPLQTVLTFLLISAEGGSRTVEEYAWNLLLFTPPWLVYVLIVLLGASRLGVARSLALGVLCFVVLSAVMNRIIKIG